MVELIWNDLPSILYISTHSPTPPNLKYYAILLSNITPTYHAYFHTSVISYSTVFQEKFNWGYKVISKVLKVDIVGIIEALKFYGD